MQALRGMIEDSSDVISLVNTAGRVLYTSASSARVFGYAPEKLVGRDAFDLIHPEDRQHSRRAVREVLAKPARPRQVEIRIRRKDGGWSWVETTISNLLEEPRMGAILVHCREIGAERAVKAQEQRDSDELLGANARLEDFAYAVAHDLREPLRTISMFTDVLVKEALLDDHGKQMAKFIVDGVSRMSVLLEGLHAFAIRGFEDPPQPLKLGPVVAQVLENLAYAIATSGATVTVDPLPVVRGNEKHLLRVLQNLIVNAIKYHSAAPIKIHVSAERLGPDWMIKVQDNGMGIAPEHHERVFLLLKRLHGPETPGAGIGLAICKKIVEAMGGTIWVESGVGLGSTFCFTIAAAKEASPEAAAPDTRTLKPSSTRSFKAAPRMRRAMGGQ